MPNKKAPSVEEAKTLFLASPNKLLKEWSKEWGVSVERVRQLKVQAGLSIGNDIDYEVAEQVIVNHHAPFPVPTELKQVYSWIQKGKIWEDTEWQRVDAKMSYDQMATEQILNDIITKLTK